MRNFEKKLLVKLLSICLVFLSTYLISILFLQDVYLFNWTARNNYLYFWLIALIWVVFDKYVVAVSIAVGHIVGLFLGIILDKIRLDAVYLQYSMAELTESHNNLLYLKGAYYWFFTVMIFMIVGILLQKFVFKSNEPSTIKTLFNSFKEWIKNKSCD